MKERNYCDLYSDGCRFTCKTCSIHTTHINDNDDNTRYNRDHYNTDTYEDTIF